MLGAPLRTVFQGTRPRCLHPWLAWPWARGAWPARPYGLDDYVNDVLAALAQIDGKAVLVGHSMGGAPVQKAMSRACEQVAAAVLLASMVPGSMTAR